MTRAAILLAAAASFSALAAVPASAAERSWSVPAFHELDVRGPYDVVVRTGERESVRAEGEREALENALVEVKGDRLVITRKKRSGLSGWFGGDGGSVRVIVTVPRLEAAMLKGSGDLTVDRMEGRGVALSLAGSGDLSVGAVEAGKVTVKVAGSGDVDVAGSCEAGSISIAGSGDIAAGRLACRTLAVDVAGSGDIEARATETAAVSIAGSGNVRVTGGARCRSSISGSGEVDCS